MPDDVVSPNSVVAPDPQLAVDAALSTPATATEPTVTTTTPPRMDPAPTTDSAPTLPPVPPEPLPTTPEPVIPSPAAPVAAPEMGVPVPPPLPPSRPDPLPPSAVTPEELPLALKTTESITPAESSKTVAAPMGETPKTVPAPNIPKSSKGAKILGFVAGFVLLVSGILGGFAYYANQFQKMDPVIAGILTSSYTKDQCHGCLRGGKLVWRGGECVQSGTCKEGDDDLQWLDIKDAAKCNQAGGVYCAGCGGFCNISSNRGCNDLQVAKCGEYPTYGANWTKAVNGQCPAGFGKKCNCGTSDYCFSSDGYCGNEVGQASQDTLDHGLCQITDDPTKQGDGIADRINDGEGTEIYFCANRFEDLAAGCQDQLVGSNFDLSCFCGTVQIDRPGRGFESKTMKCGCKEDTPDDKTRSMACTGIARSPNGEVKTGDKVTVTCAGKITGVPGASLTYNFRYRVNSAGWKTLAKKTTTTAELTVAACGSYQVQCQTCVKVLNVTKCDPVWQGANIQ